MPRDPPSINYSLAYAHTLPSAASGDPPFHAMRDSLVLANVSHFDKMLLRPKDVSDVAWSLITRSANPYCLTWPIHHGQYV